MAFTVLGTIAQGRMSRKGLVNRIKEGTDLLGCGTLLQKRWRLVSGLGLL